MPYRCHYIFINILKSVQTLILYGLFQIFHCKLSHAHYRIVCIARTNQTRLLPFILNSVRSFTLAFNL